MSETKIKTYNDFVLPLSIVTKSDVSRLVREVEVVDSDMSAASIRSKSGGHQPHQPVLSDQLTEFLSQNKLDLDTARERDTLISGLRQLKEKVPVIHMTFAVSADRESLQKLAQWLRSSVHPQTVITVGLQPALVAGVYVRTPNHVKDLSVRGMLEARHDLLVQELETLRVSK